MNDDARAGRAANDQGRDLADRSADVSIRVLIATDIRLYREGLALILARYPDLRIVASATESTEVVPRVRESQPDIVLLDMAMRNGQTVAREIITVTSGVHVVALTVPCSEQVVLDCAASGVIGYVMREASADDLIAALRSAGRGELRCPAPIATILQRRLAGPVDVASAAGADRLTSREREILRLVDEGLANKAIAQRLGIEVATVKNHVHNILEKLSVHRRAQAVANARSQLNPIASRI